MKLEKSQFSGCSPKTGFFPEGLLLRLPGTRQEAAGREGVKACD